MYGHVHCTSSTYYLLLKRNWLPFSFVEPTPLYLPIHCGDQSRLDNSNVSIYCTILTSLQNLREAPKKRTSHKLHIVT